MDGETDQFLIDSSEVDLSADLLWINDFEINRDVALIDGARARGSWSAIQQALAAAGVAANAAPRIKAANVTPPLTLYPGVQGLQIFTSFGTDPDGDSLELVVVDGPNWLFSFNATLSVTTPAGLRETELAGLSITLGLYDGRAVTLFVPELALGSAPAGDPDRKSVV